MWGAPRIHGELLKLSSRSAKTDQIAAISAKPVPVGSLQAGAMARRQTNRGAICAGQPRTRDAQPALITRKSKRCFSESLRSTAT